SSRRAWRPRAAGPAPAPPRGAGWRTPRRSRSAAPRDSTSAAWIQAWHEGTGNYLTVQQLVLQSSIVELTSTPNASKEDAMTTYAPPTSTLPTGYLTGTWDIDPSHSEVAFTVRHLMVSKVRGRFDGFSGSFVTAERPEDSHVEATIDLESIDTN